MRHTLYDSLLGSSEYIQVMIEHLCHGDGWYIGGIDPGKGPFFTGVSQCSRGHYSVIYIIYFLWGEGEEESTLHTFFCWQTCSHGPKMCDFRRQLPCYNICSTVFKETGTRDWKGLQVIMKDRPELLLSLKYLFILKILKQGSRTALEFHLSFFKPPRVSAVWVPFPIG